VDLCRRLRAEGESVRYVPAAEVVHDARRASRRDARLAMQHLKSIARFLSRR
jgi:N-acetylglucosaminyl-diphospho-decaprenol L-rhamnosyltransferase